MKKKMLPLLILPCALMFTGCSPDYLQLTKDNMSEMTETYFYGECADFKASLSSGKREEPYVYDGLARDNCDFALINMTISSAKDKESVLFTIDGETSTIIMEYNPVTSTYMYDLERKIETGAVISVKYGNTELTLNEKSKDFTVGFEQAIEIGFNEFNEEIVSLVQNDQLRAEIYLKVLDKLTNGYDDPFWCFSVVDTKGNHLNCIIDVTTGDVLAKT